MVKISASQSWGPRFNPRPGRGLKISVTFVPAIVHSAFHPFNSGSVKWVPTSFDLFVYICFWSAGGKAPLSMSIYMAKALYKCTTLLSLFTWYKVPQPIWSFRWLIYLSFLCVYTQVLVNLQKLSNGIQSLLKPKVTTVDTFGALRYTVILVGVDQQGAPTSRICLSSFGSVYEKTLVIGENRFIRCAFGVRSESVGSSYPDPQKRDRATYRSIKPGRYRSQNKSRIQRWFIVL